MTYPYPALPAAADQLATLMTEHGWQVRRSDHDISGGRRGFTASGGLANFYQHEVAGFRNGLVIEAHWERDLDNDKPFYRRPYPVGRWAFEGAAVRPGSLSKAGVPFPDRPMVHMLYLPTLARLRPYVMQDAEVQRATWDRMHPTT